MGGSPQPLIALNLKEILLENGNTCNSSNGFLWTKVLGAQTMMGLGGKQTIKTNTGWWRARSRRILMKRRAFPKGTRRPSKGIKRRVKTLKKLVPNGKSKGLDGLFRETADYIMHLQMKVKVMQMMVDLLSKAEE